MANSLFHGIIDKAMGVCVRVFGTANVYYFKEQPDAPFNVNGIFDEAGIVIETAGDIPVESRHPVFAIKRTDFTDKGHRLPKKGDNVHINGTMYEVTKAGSEDDWWSEMRLVLMKKGTKPYA